MELIALINSRSNRQADHRSVTVEAPDYDGAYAKVQELLTEDDRLLSVRRP